MRLTKTKTGLLVATSTLALVSAVRADTINLTTIGASNATSDPNAQFYQVTPKSTGTGVIHSFLVIQQDGSESGFNSSVKNSSLPLDDKSGTDAVTKEQIGVATIGDVDYYAFFLDANQLSSSSLLTLERLQIYTTSTPDLTSLSDATLVYDHGAGNTVELDAGLSDGSGQGDMAVYVKKALIDGGPGDNVVLYSAFGSPGDASNDGFEEWYTILPTAGGPSQGPPVNTPLPTTASAGAACLALLVLTKLRRRRDSLPAV
jgi:hypothetical protein